jgi:hypothetical protein
LRGKRERSMGGRKHRFIEVLMNMMWTRRMRLDFSNLKERFV